MTDLNELATRALVAQSNHEPLFVTPHEYWVIKRSLASPDEEAYHSAWRVAVEWASYATGLKSTGDTIPVKVVDKLACTT